MSGMLRRTFLGQVAAATLTSVLPSGGLVKGKAEESVPVKPVIHFGGCPAVEMALRTAAGIYPKNRRKDMLSIHYATGYRMTVSPEGYPIAICTSPDLTFGVLGSRYLPDDLFIKTFIGVLDMMPRSMRRNGKFYLNEDMLIVGGDRVMSHVMYPYWIWELYLATGDLQLLRRHCEPLLRCLSYIESRTAPNGVVNQVDHDDWQLSEGADWVDWSPERMEGSTCVYHTWFTRALAHCVRIFRLVGDSKSAEMLHSRYQRQLSVLNSLFWNGKFYYDNLNFNGRKVANFWTDSQVWPIAYGFASSGQAASIFTRIDAEPKYFEGVPMRWCPSVSAEEAVRHARDYPDMPREPHLRPYTWFGRLGAGGIFARLATGQHVHAFSLLNRYCELVVKYGTCMECLDMKGNIQEGTSGGRDYLEHAGGLLLATGRGLWGIDDTANGTLAWTPWLPPGVSNVCLPYWHQGHCWLFGYENGQYWIDPQGGKEDVRITINGKDQIVPVSGRWAAESI